MLTNRPNLLSTSSWLRYGIVCLLVTGCAAVNSQPPTGQETSPTPTIAAFFQDTPTKTSSSPSPVRLSPTATSAPTPQLQAPTRVRDQIAAIALYDDTLNADWSMENSEKVKYDVDSTAFVHGGKKAIMVTPTDDFGRFFLTVRKDAQKIYPRDRILGISFWLSGGANSIGTSDLAVAVTGSNQYTYWVSDDTSVKIDAPITADSPLFSETRLYYLHINRSIPPGNWVEVIVWLDDLIQDPSYTNVTGVYVKNDQGFLSSYYIDDVQLLVQRQL